MSRLIDADELRDFLTQDESRLRKEYDKENDDTILAWIQESEFIQNKIQEMPTVDAEPVRHGHWEKSKDDNDRWRCSHCGYTYIGFNGADTTFAEMCSYCPNCGALMDEEVEE